MPGLDIQFPAVAPIWPEIIVTITVCLVILTDLVLGRGQRQVLTWLAIAGYVLAGVVSVAMAGPRVESFSGMVVVDYFTLFFRLVFLATAILTVLIAWNYMDTMGLPWAEFLALHGFATIGMMILGAAGDLIAVFVGLELMTIAVYILTAFNRHDPLSVEAAVKYFLLGIFATAILVYGMAWTYGMTGATNLGEIARYLQSLGGAVSPGLGLALLLLLAGLGFKVAAVPFHMWTPDAYQGAPTPVSAFMSVGPKAAGFAAMIRILAEALPALRVEWTTVLIVLAVLTMVLGNVVAVAQRSVKRMLAYSSIAHTGYVLVGFAAARNPDAQSLSAVLFYAAAYMFMNLVAFGVIAWMETQGSGDSLSDFNGLSTRAPLVALVMALAMFSLTGIPPTAGFAGKFLLFMAAIQSGLTWLAVVGVLTSAVSAFYYLGVVVQMYMREPSGQLARRPTSLMSAGLALSSLGILVLGIYPGPIINLARAAFAL